MVPRKLVADMLHREALTRLDIQKSTVLHRNRALAWGHWVARVDREAASARGMP